MARSRAVQTDVETFDKTTQTDCSIFEHLMKNRWNKTIVWGNQASSTYWHKGILSSRPGPLSGKIKNITVEICLRPLNGQDNKFLAFKITITGRELECKVLSRPGDLSREWIVQREWRFNLREPILHSIEPCLHFKTNILDTLNCRICPLNIPELFDKFIYNSPTCWFFPATHEIHPDLKVCGCSYIELCDCRVSKQHILI